MVITSTEFAQRVVDAGLMTPAELDRFLAGLPEKSEPEDGGQLARQLVQKHILTAYQAQALYQGKGKLLVVGKYVILGKLGQGGMGVVFKAQHRTMRRTVALKMLSRNAKQIPGAVKRFQREVQAAGLLEHPNIVTAYDADEVDGQPFLVLQYVEGANLATLVRERGPLPVAMAISCVLQAAHGLEYAHQRGVVHRDIKPGNLLLDCDGTLKILDLGLVRFDAGRIDTANPELTDTGELIGTADYMAPEQSANMKLSDQRSDIYSLGYTLWYLLTGREPYAGESRMERLIGHWEKPIPSLREACPDVSAGLESVFVKMVAKKPEDRYQTMTEVITDLERCRLGEAAAASHPLSSLKDRELADFFQVLADEEADRGAGEPRRGPAERGSNGGKKTAVNGPGSSSGGAQPRSQRPQVRAKAAAEGHAGRQPRKRRLFASLVRPTMGVVAVAALVAAMAVFFRNEAGTEAPTPAPPLPTSSSAKKLDAVPPFMGVKDSVRLFNGKDVNDWQQVGQARWEVQGDILKASGQPGWLASKGKYANFVLALEYRLAKGSAGGIFVRAAHDGPMSEFWEVQLIEDAAAKYQQMADPQHAPGPDADSRNPQDSRPLVQFRAPADCWNKIIIRAVGGYIQVWNGTECRSIDLSQAGSHVPSKRSRSDGCIGLSFVRASLEFRELRLRELTSDRSN